MTKATIKQTEGKEVPTEIIAQEILTMSEGIKKLRAGRLNDRALILLIQGACPTGSYKDKAISQKTIRTVLNAIESLSVEYLKP